MFVDARWPYIIIAAVMMASWFVLYTITVPDDTILQKTVKQFGDCD